MLERFGQHDVLAEWHRDAGRPIAGREEKRDALAVEDFGNGRRPLAAKIDVEDRRIEPFRLDELKGFRGIAGRPDRHAAEIAQHILDQHGDHGFVFDDENAGWGQRMHRRA